MGVLLPLVFLALSALCFWKAAPIGRELKRLDGGRLGRENHDLGGDARSYPFFVRLSSLMFGILGLAGLAGQLFR